MRLARLVPFIICLGVLTSTQVSAKKVKVHSVKRYKKKRKRAHRKRTQVVDFELSSSLNSSLHSPEDVEQKVDMDFALATSMKLRNGFLISNYFSGNKDLKNERNFNISDSSISLSKKIVRVDFFTFKWASSIYIPLSESSRKVKKLNTAIAFSPSVTYKSKRSQSSISYIPSFRYNFYSYNVDYNGESNYNSILSNSLVFAYRFNKNTSIRLVGGYGRSFTEEGYTKDHYKLSQSLNIQMTKKANFSFGHSNGGNPLMSNGQNSKINIYNDRKSIVYTGLTISI